MSSAGLIPPLPSTPRPSMTVSILPPLPAIQSERIRRQIFTHPSLVGGHRDDFQAFESDPSPDNEELAHIGDQVFSLAVTDLIQALYPHLRVGPSSKVRDYVKRKDVLAQVSVLYGLHERLGLPELQAGRLRASQNVQAQVFKAFVGGLYRDRGFEVVREWLTPHFRFRLKNAYEDLREAYLVEPATEVTRQTAEPSDSYPSLPSPPLSQNAERAFPSSPGDNPDQPSRRVQSQANRSQQESGQARGGVGARSEAIDQPGRRHRRRPASPRGGGRGDANSTPSRRRTATGSDTTGRTRTWARSRHVDNA
ncbi:ribonuclease III domain-containing protein [Lactifluus subvellereus]|nr:ribonuclease III domain-containing protein [Lactifluus subvellereus]